MLLPTCDPVRPNKTPYLATYCSCNTGFNAVIFKAANYCSLIIVILRIYALLGVRAYKEGVERLATNATRIIKSDRLFPSFIR
jgi:hypothetical protein